MLNHSELLSIGGDSRQIHLINHLLSKGYMVSSFGLESELLSPKCNLINNYKEALEGHKVIIGPTPFSKDGKQINTLKNDIIIYINELKSYLTPEHLVIGGSIPGLLSESLSKKNIPYIDLLEDNSVAIANAVSTAEGAIAKAITKSPINLNNAKCLLLGYGRCGKVLAGKLTGLGADVFITTRNKENNSLAASFGFSLLDYAHLKNEIKTFDFIFNTVPEQILSAEYLSLLNGDVTVIDIASAPGGLDYDYVNKNKINAYLYLGIPGKISPKSSGMILANAITEYLKERSEKVEKRSFSP